MILLSLFYILALVTLPLSGCTGIRLTTTSKSIIYGRTLEFNKPLNSHILFLPKHYTCKGITPEGGQGIMWKTKYAVVGMNALGYHDFVDGVNDIGLAGGLFYFPNYSEYQKVSARDKKHTIAPWQLLTWILTQCASVEEVKKQLPKIKVGSAVLPEWNIVLPIHAIIHDTQGKSVVIEYVHGQLYLHDNPLGVLTNAPAFDWHITNLRNYLNVNYLDIPQVSLTDLDVKALSTGSGMHGLPGDFTSPSRFVRAVAFTQSSVPQLTEEDAINAAFHLLNLFDIPAGAVRTLENNKQSIEYTQWTSACDLKNKRYYYHTYQSRTPQVIDLMAFTKKYNKATTIPLKTKNHFEVVP